jgi:2-polyprenyl-6-methoxyphenol hydroxylase-like FAD-dependent oxidoreductase
MAHVERILIVGGGIASLTLATALYQHGFTAELIERSPSWHAIGAGLAVQPNGIRILRALGMGTAIEQAGTRIHHWNFCDQQGEVLSQTDLEELWKDMGPFIGIERIKLQQVLLAGAAAVPSRRNNSRYGRKPFRTVSGTRTTGSMTCTSSSASI